MSDNILTKLSASGAPTADTRPRYTFKVPEASRQFPTDPVSITFVPIRVADEQDALRVAESSGGSFQTELIRRSVVAVDGKQIDWAGGGDGWIERVSPKVREHVYSGYRKVNENSAEDKKAFLDSLVVDVP